MTTFDKREEGFEKKFAHDEELRFKANARRNKLLGAWAAAKLGLSGTDADAYAKDVVMSDFEEAGDEDGDEEHRGGDRGRHDLASDAARLADHEAPQRDEPRDEILAELAGRTTQTLTDTRSIGLSQTPGPGGAGEGAV